MAVRELTELDQLANVLTKYKELQQTVQEQGEKIGVLEQELATSKGELKQLEVFRPLLEDETQYWTLTVRDKAVCQQLLGRALQVFGAAANVTASGDEARRYARQKVDFIVTAAVREAVGPGWHRVYSKYIKDANRVE